MTLRFASTRSAWLAATFEIGVCARSVFFGVFAAKNGNFFQTKCTIPTLLGMNVTSNVAFTMATNCTKVAFGDPACGENVALHRPAP
jgi:hypothetical protein